MRHLHASADRQAGRQARSEHYPTAASGGEEGGWMGVGGGVASFSRDPSCAASAKKS